MSVTSALGRLSRTAVSGFLGTALLVLSAGGCKAGPSGEPVASQPGERGSRDAHGAVDASAAVVSAEPEPPTAGSSAEAASSSEPPQGLARTREPEVKITVVLENRAYDKRLKSAWGFAALIQDQDEALLFDTGPDGDALLFNLRRLGLDPAQITKVALSHIHHDHTGGLAALLGVAKRPTVYLLPSFPAVFKRALAARANPVQVSPGQKLGRRLFSTGEMSGAPAEQAVVVRTSRGLVVVTGCAHPGVVQMVERAQELFDSRVHLVIGGFHLLHKRDSELDRVVSEFRRLGVERVAPCHCTGDRAMKKFAVSYSDDFVEVGSGRVIVIPPLRQDDAEH